MSKNNLKKRGKKILGGEDKINEGNFRTILVEGRNKNLGEKNEIE